MWVLAHCLGTWISPPMDKTRKELNPERVKTKKELNGESYDA